MMPSATVHIALWAFTALLSGVTACVNYEAMDHTIPLESGNNSETLNRRWFTVLPVPGRSTFASVWPSSTVRILGFFFSPSRLFRAR